MAFAFRIRFELVETDHVDIDVESVEVGRAPRGPTIVLRAGVRGMAIKASPRLVLLGSPYESLAAAKAAAAHHRERLLAAAARRRLAIDLGDDFARRYLSPAGVAEAERQHGRKVRADVHGVDVFELLPDGGPPLFAHVSTNAGVKIGGDTLLRMIRDSLADPPPFDGQEGLAAEISALGRFIPSFRARFLTLMSGIEALIEAAPRSRRLVKLIGGIQKRVRSLAESTADGPTRQALASSLEYLKRESIGQGGKRLATEVADKEYLGKPAARFFAYIYALRSQILHAGKTSDPDVDLLEVANATSEFLADILRQRIERRTGRCDEVPTTIEAIGTYREPSGARVVGPIPYPSPRRPTP